MRAEFALGAHRMSHSREAHRESLHHSLDTSCNTALQYATRARGSICCAAFHASDNVARAVTRRLVNLP